MSKYTRHQSVVTRQVDEGIDGDHWLQQFAKSLQKGAVQPRSTDQSLFEQINSIMNTKSKYPSVDAAVEDMKARSGLTAYLEKEDISKMSTPNSGNKKIASDQNKVIDKKVDMEIVPIVIKKCPAIKNTLENYVRDTKGNLPIPAIVDKLRSIHQGDVSDAKDWDDDKLLHLVSKLNLNAKKNNPAVFENYSNLGTHEKMNDSEIDPSNVDAFHSLNPVKF
jgi:hypothetical protein